MSDTTKYSLQDILSIVDINGRVYRAVITAISKYSVAKLIGNIEVIAQQYSAPHDTVDKENTLFYICEPISGETASFSQMVIWDDIIDFDKTEFITKRYVFKMSIVPNPVQSGVPIRSIEAIIANIKTAIASNVSDTSCTFTDITTEEDNELDRLRTAVELALNFFDEVNEIETIRPLVEELKSLDVQSMTTNILNALSTIQARLSIAESGGANILSTQSQSLGITP